jgi:hypothetical protein
MLSFQEQWSKNNHPYTAENVEYSSESAYESEPNHDHDFVWGLDIFDPNEVESNNQAIERLTNYYLADRGNAQAFFPHP